METKLSKEQMNRDMTISGVIFYCDYVPPYAGNFIGSMKALAQCLKEQYCSKVVFVFPKASEKCAWVEDLNVIADSVCFLDMKSLEDGRTIGKLVKQYNISIIHAHFAKSRFFLFTSIGLSQKKDIKIFVHMHNHCWDESNRLKRAYKHFVFENKYFIGCGESVSNSMIENGYRKDRVFCVPNAIDFDRLDKTRQVEEIPADDKCKCLIYGADPRRKGVDLAIQAISDLNKDNQEIELYICVSRNKENTKKFIISRFGNMPEWCHILPPIEEIGAYYRECDLFLSPSREEGLCYAIIEAYYCGSKVIASRVPGQMEINLVNINWIETENADMLRDEIIEMRTKTQNKLANRVEAEEKYGLDQWVNEIVKIYQS